MKTISTDKYTSSTSAVRSTNFVRVGVLASSLLAGLMAASSASAASACKGLDNSACGASNSCAWVESYQRKDGRTVKAFCRTKSGAKKSLTKKAPKQTNKSVAKNGA